MIEVSVKMIKEENISVNDISCEKRPLNIMFSRRNAPVFTNLKVKDSEVQCLFYFILF